jgi:multisubunit Na+/H+ antiporter MnhF subunit
MLYPNLSFFDRSIEFLIALLVASIIICFVRLMRGPDVANRAVAFDLIAIHAVGIIALFAVYTDSAALADAAIIISVLGFLGTVMLARYWEQSNNQ